MSELFVALAIIAMVGGVMYAAYRFEKADDEDLGS